LVLLSSLLSIFFIIATGFFCYKKNIFTPGQISGIELLLIKVIMPAYLFATTYQQDLNVLFNPSYILAFLLVMISIQLSIAFLFMGKMPTLQLSIRMLAGSYISTGLYALPIVTILLHDPTAVALSMFIQLAIIQPGFTLLLGSFQHKEKSTFQKIAEIFKTPLITLPVLGIALNALEVNVNAPLLKAITQLGNGSAGVALLVFGLSLGATNITKKDLKADLLILVGIKNILHPLLAVGIGYILNLGSYWYSCLIIISSAPTALIVYFIAKQFSAEEDLVKKTIALSSVLSVFTLGLIVYLM
jgi:malonate transporter and related proteins